MLVFKNALGLFKLTYYTVSSGLLVTLLRVLLNDKKDVNKQKKLSEKLGKQLILFLPKMGPAFVKLGQTLSTRSDLVGEYLSQSLSKLQDKMPCFRFKTAKSIVENQLKGEIGELFTEFEEVPCAAASIAQVHKARTQSGKQVAVKILRPKIHKKFQENLNLMCLASAVLTFFLPEARRLKLTEVVDTIKRNVEIELDLRLEGAAADKLRANAKTDIDIYIPRVFWEYTNSDILTTEWVEGIPINDKQMLIKKGHNMPQLAKKLAIIFFNQAYRDGFFHADIHPGNIFVMDNGDIALVDFGIIGYLDYNSRIFMAQILYGFLNKNYKYVAEVHFKAGLVPEGQSKEMFELACRSIGEPIIGKPVEKISISQLIKQLFEVSRTFSMKIQPELLLFHKTIITLEGTGYFLYPKVNMWHLAEPWIKNWGKKNLGKRGKIKRIKYDTEELFSNVFNALLEHKNLPDKIKNNSNENTVFLKRIAILLLIFVLGIFVGKIFIIKF